jgi:uncharacterized cupin superfamily protein
MSSPVAHCLGCEVGLDAVRIQAPAELTKGDSVTDDHLPSPAPIMHVPPGGGPPPHRHDFEEMFTVLEGEVEVTFRGVAMKLTAGQTVNVSANAPHSFRNLAESPARLLCLCAPAGQDEFFTLVGQAVATRTEAPAPLDDAKQAAFIAKAMALAPQFRTELIPPPGQGAS